MTKLINKLKNAIYENELSGISEKLVFVVNLKGAQLPLVSGQTVEEAVEARIVKLKKEITFLGRQFYGLGYDMFHFLKIWQNFGCFEVMRAFEWH